MNQVELKRAWAEINLDGLAHNMQQIKEIIIWVFQLMKNYQH